MGRAADKFRADAQRGFDSAVRAANGQSYIDQALAVRDNWNANANNYLAAGRDPNVLYAAQITSVLKQLDSSQIDNVIAALRGLDDVAVLFAEARKNELKIIEQQTAAAQAFASGSPGAGAFYSSNAQGMIRLGSDPAGTITVDGAGGSGPLVATVLRDLIMTTLALPAGYLDEASVTSTAVIAPYTGGWAWTGQESGREAIKPLLAGLGARLPARGARPFAHGDSADAGSLSRGAGTGAGEGDEGIVI
ncbi:MAG: hypothetical protein EB034_13910 [Verrucomicrobia bacterium]|nr:hypothetical protein [Verrucomicrobiota bacterium]